MNFEKRSKNHLTPKPVSTILYLNQQHGAFD